MSEHQGVSYQEVTDLQRARTPSEDMWDVVHLHVTYSGEHEEFMARFRQASREGLPDGVAVYLLEEDALKHAHYAAILKGEISLKSLKVYPDNPIAELTRITSL